MTDLTSNQGTVSGEAEPAAQERACLAGKTTGDAAGQCAMMPIGVVRTPFPDPKGTPLEPSRAGGARATVWIDEPYRKALLDLDGFDRIWLLFWLHKAPKGQPLVTPFLDVKQHGLFATRAPARFNPLGLSAVRLLEVHEDHLVVADVDIVDGSPLLDIKPYVAEFDSYPESRAGWFAENRNPASVADARFTPQKDGASSSVEISIEGMKCPNCVGRIQNALAGLPGVVSCIVEIGTATVAYRLQEQEPAAILAAIEALGFPARLRQA